MAATKNRVPRLAVLAALALALVGAGCGGDDKKEYRDKVNDANKKFESQLAAAGAKMRAAGQSKSRQQYGEGAKDLQTAVTTFNSTLEDLDTPGDAEDEQKALTGALNTFSATVGRINDAVQSDDESAIRAEIGTLQSEAQRVESAGDDLEEAVK